MTTGAATASSLTVNGAATATSLTVNGAATATSLTVNGAATATSLTVHGETAIEGSCTVGGQINTPYIFSSPSAASGNNGAIVALDAEGNNAGGFWSDGSMWAKNKRFRIPHPVSPQEKDLVHGCVEDPNWLCTTAEKAGSVTGCGGSATSLLRGLDPHGRSHDTDHAESRLDKPPRPRWARRLLPTAASGLSPLTLRPTKASIGRSRRSAAMSNSLIPNPFAEAEAL